MTVQKENGFTQIANELLEVVPQFGFNGTQLRIIMIVWRYTYGFKRKEHEIAISFIVKATGITKRQIQKEISNLIEQNVLTEVKKATFNQSRIIAFNKDYRSWSIGSQVNNSTPPNKKAQMNDSGIQQVNDSTPQQVNDSTPKKERTKDNYKEIQSQEIFDYYISKNIIQHKKFDSGMKNKVKNAIKKHGYDELVKVIDNYSTVFHSRDYWFTYKYGLMDLMRDKDIRQFGSEGDPLYNFLKDKSKHNATRNEDVPFRPDSVEITEDDYY